MKQNKERETNFKLIQAFMSGNKELVVSIIKKANEPHPDGIPIFRTEDGGITYTGSMKLSNGIRIDFGTMNAQEYRKLVLKLERDHSTKVICIRRDIVTR